MIVTVFIKGVCSLLSWLGGLIPTVEVPDWMANASTWLAGVGPVVSGLHNWVPVDGLAVAVVWLLGLAVLIPGIRLFRILVSLFTAGGGSAA